MNSQVKGDSYEEFIHLLCSRLENHKKDIRHLKLGRKNKIKGISGCEHQIDISFFDYSLKKPIWVLIECKNNARKCIEKQQIAAFSAIINDIKNLNTFNGQILGIFAYAYKARKGAIAFAKHYNIQMEKTGVKPNFSFKYDNIIQAGIMMTGKSSLIIKNKP